MFSTLFGFKKGLILDMNNLLIFFALPIATIILAAVLEKILNCPLAVAAVAFAIYLIVTFAVYDSSFLIATIVYTILAFITALVVRFVCNLINNGNEEENCLVSSSDNVNTVSNMNNNSCSNNNCNCNCGCNCRRRF